VVADRGAPTAVILGCGGRNRCGASAAVVQGGGGGRSSREAVDAIALGGGGGGRPRSRREPRPRLRKLRPLLRELAAGWFCSSPGCLRARCPQCLRELAAGWFCSSPGCLRARCPQCLRELAARVSSRVCGERAGGHRPGEEEVIGGRWLCPARARFAG
jgi:hypothetical protein